MIRNIIFGAILLSIILLSIKGYSQGTCVSPDGTILSITVPPVDYNELNDNGYCINDVGETKWHNMCWTFTPIKSQISINAGYNTSCNIAQFDLANTFLYNSSCNIVGIGINFSIIPNQKYTWCLRLKASGGPFCNGFDRICPYYIQSEVLPIKLKYLECDSGNIIWQTASEINNDFFSLYSSEDLNTWTHKIDIQGSGNSNTNKTYHYYDANCVGELYYMLEQTDYDGDKSFEGIVHCECLKYITPEYIIEEYNILGQIYDGRGIKILKIHKGDKVVYSKIIKL